MFFFAPATTGLDLKGPASAPGPTMGSWREFSMLCGIAVRHPYVQALWICLERALFVFACIC